MAAEDPGAADDVVLWPQFEYVHPAGGRPRQRVGALDYRRVRVLRLVSGKMALPQGFEPRFKP